MQEITVEDIILRYSKRGMDIVRENMQEHYCEQAARKILSLDKGKILITTGFYVAGYAETDGPPGAMVLAKALQRLGFRPYMLTDRYCRDFFEPEGLPVIYAEIGEKAEWYESILEEYRPVCLIAVERCGKNRYGEYTNMRGESISAQTAKIDIAFEFAKKHGIATVGIGDGGNEIGMGNQKERISDMLQVIPCEIEADELVAATVSNWGAYGLLAYMQKITGCEILPSGEEIKNYLDRIVTLGSVDGVTKEHVATVDGFPFCVEEEILDALHGLCAEGSSDICCHMKN